MANAVIEMPEKEVKQLAFDVACGFFKEDQLCTRFDLDIRQLRSIQQQRAFLKEVDEIRRLLNDDGSEYIIKAKSMVDDCLDAAHSIVQDTGTSDAARLKASQFITNIARVRTAPAKIEDGPSIGALIINTNLDLNQNPKGSYTIEAAPVQQAIEAEYVEENHDLL